MGRGKRQSVAGPLPTTSSRTKPRLIKLADGTHRWWLHDKLHREDSPAVEWPGGRREWWQDGEFHREDGPAVEWANGSRSWWLHGKRHREDGPAIEWPDGMREWWLNGVPVDESDLRLPPPQLASLGPRSRVSALADARR